MCIDVLFTVSVTLCICVSVYVQENNGADPCTVLVSCIR